MNKQRKVLITITYNEMGIIIDTKTEELGSSAQPEKRTEERTETNGVCLDAISRQAAIEKILGQPPEPHYPSWYAEQIKELPPAEPKTGKWIKHIDDLFPEESTIECDQCHEHQPLTIDDNFCPNCGAKMEGDAE